MFKKETLKKAMFVALISSMFLTAIGCQKIVTDKQTEAETEAPTVQETLVISAASSLKEALNEVAKAYSETNTNVKLTFNFGGSGTLAQQIEQGAEVDLFLSASKKQMTILMDKGLILEGSSQELLGNRLVVVKPNTSQLEITSLDTLKSDKIKSIAVGEAKSVPAGQYALEAFGKLNLTDALTPKLIYGKDVKEVLTWVETGNVDAGLVYLTDANASKKVTIVAEVPENAHSPIVYPMGIIAASKHIETTKAFVDFLNTGTAKTIFEQHGFTTLK